MLFRLTFIGKDYPVLSDQDVILRRPELSDFEQWRTLRERSRDFLQPWEPIWSQDELTQASFRRRVKFYGSEMRNGRSYCFLIFDKATEQLIGGVNMSRIRYGATLSCSLGYWVGVPFQGQGYMTKSVNLVCDFAFERLKLHRIEASCLLNNEISIKLLKKQGFHFEGLAQQYLKINGIWQDHFLFAKVNKEEHS